MSSKQNLRRHTWESLGSVSWAVVSANTSDKSPDADTQFDCTEFELIAVQGHVTINSSGTDCNIDLNILNTLVASADTTPYTSMNITDVVDGIDSQTKIFNAPHLINFTADNNRATDANNAAVVLEVYGRR